MLSDSIGGANWRGAWCVPVDLPNGESRDGVHWDVVYPLLLSPAVWLALQSRHIQWDDELVADALLG